MIVQTAPMVVKAPVGSLIAALLLAGMIGFALGKAAELTSHINPGIATPTDQPDWHGNVKRSHYQ